MFQFQMVHARVVTSASSDASASSGASGASGASGGQGSAVALGRRRMFRHAAYHSDIQNPLTRIVL